MVGCRHPKSKPHSDIRLALGWTPHISFFGESRCPYEHLYYYIIYKYNPVVIRQANSIYYLTSKLDLRYLLCLQGPFPIPMEDDAGVYQEHEKQYTRFDK